jgi:dTDP-4-dehydrorhamnose reductase
LSGAAKKIRQRAWVTGAGGLIGHYLVQIAKEFAAGFDVIGLTHGDLDLTDFAAVQRRFDAERPSLIIHCAAISKSPECQANPQLAHKVNVDATAHLAGLAERVRFVFFSSDLAFDGKKGNYTEGDAVNPLSVYAETKVAAEQIVLKNPLHAVVRTSLNSGTSPKGTRAYNEELLVAWRRGQTVKLFHDEYRCPIPAVVTARATWELAASGAAGLFHLTGSERLSRLEIGKLLAARHPEIEARFEACSLKEYTGAPRAADTSLNCGKIQKLLSFPLPGLTDWLKAHPEDAF